MKHDIGIFLRGLENHKFLIFNSELKRGVVSDLTVRILNYYTRKKLSKKEWIKHPPFCLQLGKNEKSEVLSYRILSDYLRNKKDFEPDDFKLRELECYWLDHQLGIKNNFHKYDGGEEALTFAVSMDDYYGESYPIELKLDREGLLFMSLQGALIDRIITKRKFLVENSNRAFEYDWFFDLRDLIANSISILDITLHQIYNKAEFDPPEGWVFSREKLGEKHAVRFLDKFKWINKITSNPLDNVAEEMESLKRLKKIRNHLMHFDPPSLIVTLEEVADWLNMVLDMCSFLIKIRDKCNLSISSEIVKFALQTEVSFNAPPISKKRKELNSAVNGYLSSTWPEE